MYCASSSAFVFPMLSASLYTLTSSPSTVLVTVRSIPASSVPIPPSSVASANSGSSSPYTLLSAATVIVTSFGVIVTVALVYAVS